MSGCGGGGGGECGSGGCGNQQQQPANSQQQQAGSFGSWARRHGTDGAAAEPAAGARGQQQHHQQQEPGVCMKCKAVPAVTTIRQHEPYCHACIENGIQQKARTGTKALGLISPGDTALLALSGGAASAALLHCMCSMQAPPDSTRPIRGKLPFQLSVLHVDCSMQQGGSSSSPSAQADSAGSPSAQQQQQQQQPLREQLGALAAAAGHAQPPLLLHLSDVFCTEQQLRALLTGQQQRAAAGHAPNNDTTVAAAAPAPQPQQQGQHMQRLQELVAAVADPTGAEDLITHLRDRLLLRAAAVLGCTRLLRGDSASSLAVRIIAEASKGRGFSLPADIQTADGRHMQPAEGAAAAAAAGGGPCILQPLREVTHKELAELCAYRHIPLLQDASNSSGSTTGGPSLLGGSRAAGGAGGSSGSSSVNALAARFVGEMSATLPASVYTIIRTAAHLEPFAFTDAAALVPRAAVAMRKHHRHQAKNTALQQEQQQQDAVSAEAPGVPHWQWCAICRAPLLPQQQQGLSPVSAADAGVQQGNAAAFAATPGEVTCGRLCYSCNRQILQQVKPPPRAAAAAVAAAPPAAAAAGAGAGGAAAGGGSSSLDARLLRLKQLLPPGMLLDSDSEEDEEAAV